MAAQLRKVRQNLDEVVSKIELQLEQIEHELAQVDSFVDKDFDNLLNVYANNVGVKKEQLQQKFSKHRNRLKDTRIKSLNQAKDELLQLKHEILAA